METGGLRERGKRQKPPRAKTRFQQAPGPGGSAPPPKRRGELTILLFHRMMALESKFTSVRHCHGGPLATSLKSPSSFHVFGYGWQTISCLYPLELIVPQIHRSFHPVGFIRGTKRARKKAEASRLPLFDSLPTVHPPKGPRLPASPSTRTASHPEISRVA